MLSGGCCTATQRTTSSPGNILCEASIGHGVNLGEFLLRIDLNQRLVAVAHFGEGRHVAIVVVGVHGGSVRKERKQSGLPFHSLFSPRPATTSVLYTSLMSARCRLHDVPLCYTFPQPQPQTPHFMPVAGQSCPEAGSQSVAYSVSSMIGAHMQATVTSCHALPVATSCAAAEVYCIASRRELAILL